MLTEKTRILLDYLIEHKDKFMFFPGDETTSLFDWDELEILFHYLAENDYILLKSFVDGAYSINLTHKGMAYKEIEENQRIHESYNPHVINNYGNISNSAVGNIGNTTINNGISFDDAFEIIKTKQLTSDDELTANRIIEYIQTLSENDVPIKKGFLSKFSDFISKHSWVPQLIASLITTYYIN